MMEFKRTHENGTLRTEHEGLEVQLLGWVSRKRNFGSIVFVDLRDRSGIVQIVFNETDHPEVNKIKSEYLLSVQGQVALRKDPNPKLDTGNIEILVSNYTIINESKVPPILVQDETDALEDTRLKFRYLDLRRPKMQAKLFKRAKIVSEIRRFLDDHGFIDVETPMLTKSTPEGSREYLVPSRVHPGEFYALAQSPQIFKQLLMISGFERYYQVARCFRDEDLRADRQLDFTQIDIETSFLNEEEFQTLMEAMMVQLFKNVMNIDLAVPFRRIPFTQALNDYGCDKPDTRFECLLKECTAIFKQTEFGLFKDAECIKAIVLENGANNTRKELDGYNELVKKYGMKGVVTFKYQNNALSGSAVKFLNESEIQNLIAKLNLKENDLVCICAGSWEPVCNALGALRVHFAQKYNWIPKDVFNFLWVTEFPMFELDAETGQLVARHHPFTRPAIQSAKQLEGTIDDLLKLKAIAYDLVLNGSEVAGGSMRIYDGAIQKKFFEIIGFSEEEINNRFGFFIDAFNYGTPPHGGMAFGLDRFVMILTQSDSIRDVIAFPKIASARDPLTNAPTAVSKKQLDELHLLINKKNEL